MPSKNVLGSWVPPYELLCQAMGIDRKANLAKSLLPSGSALLLLLKMALENSAFDDEAYLRDNPDLRTAVENGKIANPKEHYIEYGYFEGRPNHAGVVVDETWYLNHYPDVAAAIESGKIKSAAQHYQQSGIGEMRAPNASVEPLVRMWREALTSMSTVTK